MLNLHNYFVFQGTHNLQKIYGTGLNPFSMMRRYVNKGNTLFSFFFSFWYFKLCPYFIKCKKKNL